jgi:hypothetical protein
MYSKAGRAAAAPAGRRAPPPGTLLAWTGTVGRRSCSWPKRRFKNFIASSSTSSASSLERGTLLARSPKPIPSWVIFTIWVASSPKKRSERS